MEYIGIIYIAIMFIITSGLTFGGYILQRDKYWIRVWEDIGRPNVKSIKELKSYIKNTKETKVLLRLDTKIQKNRCK